MRVAVGVVVGVALAWSLSERCWTSDGGGGSERVLRFDLSPEGEIMAWLVCGPFPNLPARGRFGWLDERPGFAKDWLAPMGGEKGAEAREGVPVRVAGQPPCIWRVATAGPRGHVNLLRQFSPNMHVVAYAACTLVCPRDERAVLKMGSDDGIKVWLNGRQVHVSERAAGWQPDQDTADVRLHGGRNRLLVKVDQLILGWGFSVRLLDEAGRPLRGVEVELSGAVPLEDERRMLAEAAAVELGRRAFTEGESLVVRLQLGPTAPKTSGTITARAFVENRSGTSVASLGEIRFGGEPKHGWAFAPWPMTALPDGMYRVRVDLAAPNGTPLGARYERFFYVHSYRRRLAEVKRAVADPGCADPLRRRDSAARGFAEARAAAGLRGRDGILATITLPSLERLIYDAEKRWAEFEDLARDYLFIRKQLFDAEAGALAMRQGRDWYASQSGHCVKAYRSEHDGTLQPYSVYVPRNYDPRQAWPLVIGLHEAGSNHWLQLRRLFGQGNRPGEPDALARKVMPPLPDGTMLVACPNGRESFGWSGLGEEDVWRVVADMKRAYNVDETRIYLTGLSMGGEGVWRIGLRHPDRFAAIAPICGRTDDGYRFGTRERLEPYEKALIEARSAINHAENALNLPVHIFNGTDDPAAPATGTLAIFQRLRQLGYRAACTQYVGVGNNAWDAAYRGGAMFEWFAQHQLDRWPRRVVYKAVVSKPIGAYWVRIDSPRRLRQFSRIEAAAVNNRLDVRVENVRRFSVFLNRRLVDPARAVEVVINGQALLPVWAQEGKAIAFVSDGGQFRRDFAAFEPPLLPGLGMEPMREWHTYIYGTSGHAHETLINREAAERAADWGPLCDVRWPVKRDDEVTSEDLRAGHLVLLGTPSNNRLMAQIAEALPIAVERDAIRIGGPSPCRRGSRLGGASRRAVAPSQRVGAARVGPAGQRRYRGERAGLAMIYRNPLSPDRYVFIYAAFTAEGFANLREKVSEMSPDFVLFDGEGAEARAGFFDASWQIEE